MKKTSIPPTETTTEEEVQRPPPAATTPSSSTPRSSSTPTTPTPSLLVGGGNNRQGRNALSIFASSPVRMDKSSTRRDSKEETNQDYQQQHTRGHENVEDCPPPSPERQSSSFVPPATNVYETMTTQQIPDDRQPIQHRGDGEGDSVAKGKQRIMSESTRLHQKMSQGESDIDKQGIRSDGKARIMDESTRIHRAVAQGDSNVRQHSGGVDSMGKARIATESARLHEMVTQGSNGGKHDAKGVNHDMTSEGKQRIIAESTRANQHVTDANANNHAPTTTTASQDREGDHVSDSKGRIMTERAMANHGTLEKESDKNLESSQTNNQIEPEESVLRHLIQSPVSEQVDQDPDDRTIPKEPGAFAVDGPAPIYLPADEAQLWEASHDEERDYEEPGLEGGASLRSRDCVGGPGAMTSFDTSTEDLLEPDSDNVVFDAQVAEIRKEHRDVKEAVPKVERTRCLVVAAAIVVLIIVGIVVAVVVAAGGSDGDDALSTSPPPSTRMPTSAPTIMTPTLVAPTSVGRFDECFDSTRGLANALRSRRPPYEFVDIELCPRQNFRVDDPIDFNTPWLGLNPPVSAQSNIRVKCGDDGLLRDQCVVGDGEALVLNTWSFSRDDQAQNVTFEGITFEKGATALVIMFSGGDITFKNCLFRDFSARTPIKIDFAGWDDEPDIRQIVTFDSCIFENIQYGPTDVPAGAAYPGLSALIVATGSSNTVIVRDSVFRNNNVDAGFFGSVIASLGAQVVVEQSCFQANPAGRSRSPVHLIDESFSEDSISMENNFVEGLWECDLLSIQGESGNNDTCVNQTSVAESCQSSLKDFSAFW